MIVVDASALTAALVEDSDTGRAASAVLEADPEWAAPRHLIIEVVTAIRSQRLRDNLSDESAAAAVDHLRALVFTWVEMEDLLDRVWEMRAAVTPYDAAYVAAAERLDCALVTTDTRLARYPEARCAFLTPGIP
jgi:predicted nucleic acid-binding protein